MSNGQISPAVAHAAYGAAYAFSRYCLWALRGAPACIEGAENLPATPTILAGWHTGNLLALALHHDYLWQRPAVCPTAPGLVGVGMKGQLEGFGLQAVPLPDEAANPTGALKAMLRILAGGDLVVIAVDGPHGPAGTVRPGALWLGRASGLPVTPMAFAARPAVRRPRWDRQIVPLPGSRLVAVIAPPIHVERSRKIDDELTASLANALAGATRRAWELLDMPGGAAFRNPPPLPRRGSAVQAPA